jgi:hypothetical protein
MQSFLKQKPAHHPQAISRVIDKETLILKLDTGQVSVLNGVGGHVWELMDGRCDLGAIVDAVGQAYDADPEQVAQDVVAFVQQLLERDMVAWVDG